jgi:diguanylate cyclase (GGDEF)-like protein
MLRSIDAGLIVIDQAFNIEVWNAFMENHSGLMSPHAIGKNLFELFPDLPEAWLRQKVQSVFELNIRAFSIWEQRPYLFRFNNYRPITGGSEYMFQNISFIPLLSTSGNISHVCIIIYDVTEVAQGKIALESANAQLTELSQTDRLTGLLNRGHWQQLFDIAYARYQRHRHPTSVVIFDIDHFKKVNDTYGHQAGDEVIRMCAKALKATARDIDIAGRYGGEEFVVLLENTKAEGAYVFAERLRKLIERLEVNVDSVTIKFTISMGIAELSPEIESADAWLKKADEALYQAKEGGRNQVVVAN